MGRDILIRPAPFPSICRSIVPRAAPFVAAVFLLAASHDAEFAEPNLYRNGGLFSHLWPFYLACLALHADYDREMVLAVILGSCLLVVVLSLFAYVAIPSFGVSRVARGTQIQGRRLSGITGTPNGIIISAWCAFVIAIHWHALRRYLHSSILFFGGLTALVTLALSQSRTAMAVFLVLTEITFTLRRRYTPYLLISGAIIVMVVAIFAISDSDLFVRLLSRSGNVMEIRDWDRPGAIWSLVIKLAQSSFWTGQGYASTVFILPDYSDYMSSRSTARTQHVAATLAYDGHDRRDPFQPGIRFADYSRDSRQRWPKHYFSCVRNAGRHH